MELLDLRCFLKLVEEGSVTKAASVMHMSQPNLSRHLLRLEDELGAQLYVRDPKHAKLTDAGRRLFDYASVVVGLVDEALVEVGNESALPKGQVRIGFGDAEAMALVMDAIVACRASYPGIVFHLHAGSSLTLLNRLNAGQLDFVFEVEHISRVDYCELVLPGTDVWGVYPLPGTPLADLSRVTPADLAGEPLIISRQFLKSAFLKRWAGEHYADLNPVVSMDVFPSEWRRLVQQRAGHMVGYLYFQNKPHQVLGSKGIPFDPPLHTCHALIWKKGRPLPLASQKFLEELERLSKEAEA
ncbi:LysR family transcriptional regulator [Eggerthellaceae bacterium zg-887]|uniref:LysR family transcriptional regulator n=1 Tax=Xiamenia xianingshaonis TaxID=2682776 RepID=UPI00140A179E|nr:LysR family transcriptional regulator [Xiamenia xianingshaonis]NHM15695.1 LysR family transcriptional regulator [Xiamenia xianingshaonis]